MKDKNKSCMFGDWFNCKYELMRETLIEGLSKGYDDAGIIQSSCDSNSKKAPKMPSACWPLGATDNCPNYMKCRDLNTTVKYDRAHNMDLHAQEISRLKRREDALKHVCAMSMLINGGDLHPSAESIKTMKEELDRRLENNEIEYLASL
jgi:hypothetical protein